MTHLWSIRQKICIGINQRVLQNCPAIQDQLSINRSTCQKASTVVVIIYRDSSSIHCFDQSVDRRITQAKSSAFLYNNSYTAENFHIYKCQITAWRNNQCLCRAFWFGYRISQLAICPTCMRAIPCFDLCRYCHCLICTAKSSNCPWFHIIHVFAICSLLCIFKFQTVTQFFCTWINLKCKLITGCGSAILICYCYTYRIRTRLIGNTAQWQGAVINRVYTWHSTGFRVNIYACLFCIYRYCFM